MRKTQRIQYKSDKPTRTKQAFTAECDIRNIMKRFEKTGEISHLSKVQAFYGDASMVPSYQEALNTVLDAEAAFMDLPIQVRKRFGHDPLNLCEFVMDESNRDEAIKLGIIDATPDVLSQAESSVVGTKSEVV